MSFLTIILISFTLFAQEREIYNHPYGLVGETLRSNAYETEILEYDCKSHLDEDRSKLATGQSGKDKFDKDEVTELELMQEFQLKLFEYFGIYQNAVQLEELKLKLNQCPSCIKADSVECKSYREGYTSSSGEYYKGWKLALSQKSVLSDSNILWALLRYDILKYNFKKKCLASDVMSSECFSIDEEKYRIETSFPLFFRNVSKGRMTREEATTQFIRVEIFNLLGFKLGYTKKKEAYKLGKKFYIENLSTDDKNLHKKVFDLLKEARLYLGQAKLKNLNTSIKNAKTALFFRFFQHQKDVCQIINTKNLTKATAGLIDVINFAPALIRQSLLNFSPGVKKKAQDFLCRKKIINEVKNAAFCLGVEKSKNNPNVLKIIRENYLYTWPMSSRDHYNLLQKKDSTIIQATIYFRDVSGDLDKAEKFVKEMRPLVNNYLNCQTGAISQSKENSQCPVDSGMELFQKINFSINLVATNDLKNDGNLINLHECYYGRMTEKKSDCKEIRKTVVKDCVLAGMDRRECEEKTPSVGHRDNNLADAYNVTYNVGLHTLVHEIGHSLGLRDEYAQAAYDYINNPLGESDSLMVKSGSLTPRLYPRHIRQILAPLNCF